MKLIIYTPEKIILNKDVTQVTVTTGAGEITILPNHSDLLSTLSLGNVTYRIEGHSSEDFITIEKGFLSTDGNEVKILADIAIHSADYDDLVVEELKQKAQKLMENSPKDQNIERLLSQIRIADKHLISKKRRKI